MNVQLMPVLVTRTLIAPTLTVLTTVLVDRDLLEVAPFVKVCDTCNQQALSQTHVF